jgi:hypothetical protein
LRIKKMTISINNYTIRTCYPLTSIRINNFCQIVKIRFRICPVIYSNARGKFINVKLFGE